MDKFFLDEIEKIDVLCLSSFSKTKITASNSGHKIDVVEYSTDQQYLDRLNLNPVSVIMHFFTCSKCVLMYIVFHLKI